MAEHLFLRTTTIAVIWDFDTTLIPGYMQVPLFRHFKPPEAGPDSSCLSGAAELRVPAAFYS